VVAGKAADEDLAKGGTLAARPVAAAAAAAPPAAPRTGRESESERDSGSGSGNVLDHRGHPHLDRRLQITRPRQTSVIEVFRFLFTLPTIQEIGNEVPLDPSSQASLIKHFF